MEVMLLTKDDAKDWVYKGEGAANLVLSYSGSNSFLIGKVLRIHKVPKSQMQVVDGGNVLCKEELLLWRGFEEHLETMSKEQAGQIFVKRVMSRLLDPKHVDVGIRINISKEFLETIRQNVQNQRPAWRLDAAEVDIQSDSALLISDHSLFLSSKSFIPGAPIVVTCFSVEIKPKCGFLPSSDYITKENIIKKSVTRFKMHQFLKLHERQISEISKYDPLDLFSGSEERIQQAVTALFTTPENNFRIFFNGALIYGGLGGSIDKKTAHSHKSNEDIDALLMNNGLQFEAFIELISKSLLKSQVLNKLLAAQKLDVFDIEGAIHLYYNIASEPCAVCKDMIDEEMRHKCSFLHSFSLEESSRIVREYLTAATAKDCSLMISFRQLTDVDLATEYDSILLRSCNQRFEYKANFIDLDMKPLKKMVRYYKLDQRIVDYYRKNVMKDECAK